MYGGEKTNACFWRPGGMTAEDVEQHTRRNCEEGEGIRRDSACGALGYQR